MGGRGSRRASCATGGSTRVASGLLASRFSARQRRTLTLQFIELKTLGHLDSRTLGNCIAASGGLFILLRYIWYVGNFFRLRLKGQDTGSECARVATASFFSQRVMLLSKKYNALVP